MAKKYKIKKAEPKGKPKATKADAGKPKTFK